MFMDVGCFTIGFFFPSLRAPSLQLGAFQSAVVVLLYRRCPPFKDMLIVATDSQLLRTRKKEWKKRKGGRPQDNDEDHQPPRCVLALFYRTDGRGQVLYTTPSIKYDGPVKIRVHLLACLFYFRFSIFVYIYLWWDRDDEADRQAVVEGNVSGGMQYDGSGGRSVGILVFNTPTDSAACQIRRFRHIKKKNRRWWFIFFFFA